MGHKVRVTIDGAEYVAVPRADYVRLVGNDPFAGAVDAIDYTRRSLGRSLRVARETAGLTQTALAEKLGKRQSLVSGAEAGSVHVGVRYVSAVLAACGLPPDWKAPKATRKTKKPVHATASR
jgi:ribosome-binding protein aMBF1 (putative translation factor)